MALALLQVAAETEAKAAAEAARLEAAAQAAEQDAVRYERKQRQLQEKLAKAAQEGQQLAQQKAELAVSGGSKQSAAAACLQLACSLTRGCSAYALQQQQVAKEVQAVQHSGWIFVMACCTRDQVALGDVVWLVIDGMGSCRTRLLAVMMAGYCQRVLFNHLHDCTHIDPACHVLRMLQARLRAMEGEILKGLVTGHCQHVVLPYMTAHMSIPPFMCVHAAVRKARSTARRCRCCAMHKVIQ